jgi:phosphate transport system protein
MVDVHAEFGHDSSFARRARADAAGYASCILARAVDAFNERLAHLRNDIVAQGDRVLSVTLRAVESYFDGDRAKAEAVIAADEEIDKVDVDIERASIPLLAIGMTDEKSIRSVLTIVKVNNELERVADCAVDIAEAVLWDTALPARIPAVFRVMANSVIGMLRDSNRALAAGNTALAQQVLLFDDTVANFKKELLKTAQEQVAAGTLPVDYAFRLLSITKSIERIADHCTNVCEQVIYLHAGLIVRHRPEGWSKPLPPTA